MRRALREPMTRPVWMVLLSWGLAVLVLSGLFAAWVWKNQIQQDRDMCALLGVFMAGPEPEPVPGPEGDRSRVVRAALLEYFKRRDCPVPPR